MIARILFILKLYWPMILLAVPFALVYAVLLDFFTEAIEIEDSLTITDSLWWKDGPHTLFITNSAVLGWVSVVVVRTWVAIGGPLLFLISLPCCLLAIDSGFAFGLFLTGSQSDAIRTAHIASAIVTCIAVAARTYYDNLG